MRGVIYKYTSPSGKVYIGQTLNEYMRRAMWKNINHPYAGPYINKARAKYGYSNFKYDVLISLDSNDESFLRDKKIDCFNLSGDFIKTFFSLKEASKELNIPYQAIQRVLKGNRYKTRNLIFKYHRE